MRVLRLEIHNILGVEDVVINPQETITELSGETGQGKTSILRALGSLFLGKGALPKKLLRDSETYGFISCSIGEDNEEIINARLEVTRDPKTGIQSKPKLSVTESGSKTSAPQTLFNQLGVVAGFEFLEFLRMKPKEQLENLLTLIGFDHDEYKNRERELTGERTYLKRDIKTLQAQVQNVPEELLEFADRKEEDIADLIEEQELAQEKISEYEDLGSKIREQKERIVQNNDDIKRVKAELARLESRGKELLSRYHANLRRYMSFGELPDIEAIKSRIRDVSEVNSKISAAKEAKAKLAEIDIKNEALSNLEASIESLRSSKREFIESKELPLPIEFTDDGILLNGIPLEQCSGIEQLQTAMMIPLLQGNKFPLLIADDADQLAGQSYPIVEALLEAHQAQLFITTRRQISASAITIKNGRIEND